MKPNLNPSLNCRQTLGGFPQSPVKLEIPRIKNGEGFYGGIVRPYGNELHPLKDSSKTYEWERLGAPLTYAGLAATESRSVGVRPACADGICYETAGNLIHSVSTLKCPMPIKRRMSLKSLGGSFDMSSIGAKRNPVNMAPIPISLTGSHTETKISKTY